MTSYTQNDRRLRIETQLNRIEKGDPLLLTFFHGVEQVSKPFAYDLIVLRPKKSDGGAELPPVRPTDLINTMARIDIKIAELSITRPLLVPVPILSEKAYSYIARYAIFETFKYEGANDEFRKYSATLVPAFKTMDQEVGFRIFENKTVLEIIKLVAGRNPYLEINDGLLQHEKAGTFPKMEYCVQFNESSFAFLSRLMQQFGIWYYFDHDAKPWINTMVLGRTATTFTDCQITEGGLKGIPVDGMEFTGDNDASLFTIAKAQRVYVPVGRLFETRSYNPLVPTQPFHGRSAISADHDLLYPPQSQTKGAGSPPNDTDLFRREFFPAAAYSNKEAQNLADGVMAATEAPVISITGNSRNPAFAAGRQFHLKLATGPLPAESGESDLIVADRFHAIDSDTLANYEKAAEREGGYLLIYLDLAAVEASYTAKGFFGTIFGDFLDQPADLLVGFTQQGLNNYMQNEFPYAMQNSWDPQSHPGFPDFAPFFLGGGFAAIAGLLPGIKKALSDLFWPSSNDYHNSFHAIPYDKAFSKFRALPVPEGEKPRVQGPQLAVVVGPDGVSGKGQDFHADVLGRVRVRFPWDLGPPRGTEPAQLDWHADAYSSEKNTCWVRVSQPWAGRQYGAQFLPRIGEEVLVDFLDGDPDRPVIVGRMYNADLGYTNLPFPNRGENYTTKVVLDDDKNDLLGAKPQGDFPLSGIKTRSTPSTTSEGKAKTARYHLLRFDDNYENEQLLMRSQGRLDVTSKGSSYQTTEGDRHVLAIAGKDKAGNYVGGSIHTTTGSPYFGKEPAGEYTLHVGGNRREQVDLKYQLKVLKDTEIDLKGNCTGMVAGTLSLSAASIVLQADKKITLKAGGHSIVINGQGVFADTQVKLSTGGPVDSAGSVTIPPIADAEKADPGEPANSRAGSSGGSGASGGANTAGTTDQSATSPPAPLPAPSYTQDSSNSISCPLDSLCGVDGGGA